MSLSDFSIHLWLHIVNIIAVFVFVIPYIEACFLLSINQIIFLLLLFLASFFLKLFNERKLLG